MFLMAVTNQREPRLNVAAMLAEIRDLRAANRDLREAKERCRVVALDWIAVGGHVGHLGQLLLEAVEPPARRKKGART